MTFDKQSNGRQIEVELQLWPSILFIYLFICSENVNNNSSNKSTSRLHEPDKKANQPALTIARNKPLHTHHIKIRWYRYISRTRRFRWRNNAFSAAVRRRREMAHGGSDSTPAYQQLRSAAPQWSYNRWPTVPLPIFASQYILRRFICRVKSGFKLTLVWNRILIWTQNSALSQCSK